MPKIFFVLLALVSIAGLLVCYDLWILEQQANDLSRRIGRAERECGITQENLYEQEKNTDTDQN